jgi:hypothetical protein
MPPNASDDQDAERGRPEDACPLPGGGLFVLSYALLRIDGHARERREGVGDDLVLSQSSCGDAVQVPRSLAAVLTRRSAW